MRRFLPISLLLVSFALESRAQDAGTPSEDRYAETFDAHWECLRDAYPYFELYGIDWDAERQEHRARALSASNDDEFAWELARLISALPDPHVAFIPAVETMAERWSFPEVETKNIERRPHIIAWPSDARPGPPAKFAGDANACPEIIAIQGERPIGAGQILAAGPIGSMMSMRVRWPDGTETDHELPRPMEPNLPPESRHYGEGWLIVERVGDIGYMRVRTFDPTRATLGPDGKMTTMLRAALRELRDTRGLILDFQRNGGGQVAASDPFLGNLVERRISYAWGNSDGVKRVIRPRSPRYKGEVVVLVDEDSASGGEWAARILRDAERAQVVGGRTSGAEAAVHTLNAPDGSTLHYSAWPMVEPGVAPFQEVGIELDHALPLTLDEVRKHGYEVAHRRVRLARFEKALEILGAPREHGAALLEFQARGEEPWELDEQD